MSVASPPKTISRFKPATREKLRLRMALDGPSGAGKTYTALRIAFALGVRVAVIDSEAGSAKKYQGDATNGDPWQFDVAELTTFSPTEYTSAIEEAGRAGYDVVVIDSLSHAWEGKDGALEIVNKKGGNSYTAWGDVTPMHRRMIEAMLRSPCHVIATMRSKQDYVLESDSKGKMVPRKIGMAPVQRQGMEYEFDLYGSLDWSHIMTVTKSRCSAVDGMIVHKPGASFMVPVIQWLETGTATGSVKFTPILATDSQVAEIVNAIVLLGRDMEKEKKDLFRRYAVSDFAGLTGDQAREVSGRLAAAKSKVKAEEVDGVLGDAPVTTPAAPTPPATHAGNTTFSNAPANPAPPVTHQAATNGDGHPDITHLTRLNAARELIFTALGLTSPVDHAEARAKVWGQILAKRGVQSAKELTVAQVLELEATLNAKVAELHASRGGATQKS